MIHHVPTHNKVHKALTGNRAGGFPKGTGLPVRVMGLTALDAICRLNTAALAIATASSKSAADSAAVFGERWNKKIQGGEDKMTQKLVNIKVG